jgi:2-polyprenyl-3-methyl-5-hydroxy-6-metoxy-1,4-benzoquinol methylase
MLKSENGNVLVPVIDYIPRFVELSYYADNFGMQWNLFSRTQLDSYSNLSVSSDRFYSATNWNKSDLFNKWVLDIGCGAGRFAEIALGAGANVVALDYSNSVDACYKNLLNHKNLHIVQGDIYSLPFGKETFDFVYSLGVLQHTPNVAQSFQCLLPVLKSGGSLCVDFYEKSWKSIFLPKYWIRPFSKHIPKNTLLSILKIAVPPLLLISLVLNKIPFIGKYLKRLVPVANHFEGLNLRDNQLAEWALLDTFDWFSPAFDNPQSAKTVLKWFQDSNFTNIEVLKAGHLVGRGMKSI